MISVITPVYNGVDFIEGCIQNVIDQSCSEAEHVIVDGGSNDGTVEIIRQFANKYHHIRWISEKDRGQSDAMNKGISLARGEIVGFLNADDFYEPSILNRVLELFRELEEPSLVVGNCNVWNDSGQLIQVNRPAKLSLSNMLMGQAIDTIPLNPSAYFYHKSIHNRVGFYDVEEDYVLDWDFLLRAVQVARIKYVDETWGNFRMLSSTKTYRDMQLGRSSHRQVQILKKYRSALPLAERLRVICHYYLWHEIAGTIRYFRRKPEELPGRLKSRFIRFLGLGKELEDNGVEKVK